MAKLMFLSHSPLLALLFLILFSLPFLSKSQFQPQTPQQQLQILLKIKSDWQNPASLSNWTSSNGNHCSWPEINCTADGTITAIVLQYKNLSYPIPSSICDLTNLTKIDLYRNNIPGPFPIYLSNGANLQYLDISQNYFVGRLPSDIDRLSSVQYFYLYGNNFTGDIPPEIGRMSNLIDLELHQNLFNGSVPSEIGNLANLETLVLSYLSIMPEWRIPPEFGRLKKLENLWIRNSNLTGEIPGSLTNLTDLAFLDLAGNKLSGDIPRDLFRLKNLKVAYLFYNSLSGELPRPVDALGLEDVDLSMNQLTGKIPEDFGQLRNLSYLYLYYNRISGEIPPELGNLKLNQLDLSSNQLSGQIPNGLENPIFENSFLHNRGLCASNPSIINLRSCASQSRESSKISRRVLASILAIAGFLTLVLAFLTWFVLLDYRKRKQRQDLATWKFTSFQRLDFTEANIVRGLVESNLIGSGGSGNVYRISVENQVGEVVAVKKIWNRGSLDAKLEKQFQAKIEILSRIRHSNIVKLLCCISSEDSKLLVYEYMEQGSLDRWLFDKRNGATIESGLLDWPSRSRIAVEAAQGLCYMHHSCSHPSSIEM